MRQWVYAGYEKLLPKVRPTPFLDRDDRAPRLHDIHGRVIRPPREPHKRLQLFEIHRHIVVDPLEHRALEHVEVRNCVLARRRVHEPPVVHADVEYVLLRDGEAGHEVVVRRREEGWACSGVRVFEPLEHEHRTERDCRLGVGVEAPVGMQSARNQQQERVRNVLGDVCGVFRRVLAV